MNNSNNFFTQYEASCTVLFSVETKIFLFLKRILNENEVKILSFNLMKTNLSLDVIKTKTVFKCFQVNMTS